MGPTQTGDINWKELAGFTEKQRQAIEATYTHRYILYGGARGGGKSRLLRWWLVEFLVDQFVEHGLGGVRVGLFCETYPDLRDRQVSKMAMEFPQWLGTVHETKEDGLCFFLREEFGGGKVALRNLDDPSKYQSAEFAAIGVDELTKIQKNTFDILRGSMRWPGIKHTVFMGASNPGGAGHLWVKQLWIDRDFPPELRDMAEKFCFIKSLPSDNPYLEPEYWDELNSLPVDLRRAWVEGDWTVFAGQAFPNWREHLHVIAPFTIPTHWQKWRAIDWGYSQPFCCLWLTRDPDTRRVIVYRELYEKGLTDRQQARAIRDKTTEDEQIDISFADPSMWAKKNMEDHVTSTADEYRAEGIYLRQADNERIGGKRKVDRMLMNLADGLPGLQIFSMCRNLVRTLPALAYDERRVEDIDTEQEDHAYDALRYGMSGLQLVQVEKTMVKKAYEQSAIEEIAWL